MKLTSLNEIHIELGAKMVPFAGFSMPIQYTSVKEEILSVRKSAGMFDVSHMGEFFVEGGQVNDFIDYLLPNNFKTLSVGKALYSPLLNDDGKIIDDLIAYKLSDQRALICVNAANIKKDYEWISSKTNNFDIKLTNESQDYSLIAVQGPKAVSILKSALELPSLENLSTYGVLEFKGSIIARTGYTGEDGFEVFGNHETIKNLWKSLIEKGVTPCGLAARDTLRLEACYPLYGQELSEKITPLDCGLKWTVKLGKQDFIGHKALQNYKPNYKLIKFSLEKGIPRAGLKIFDPENNEVGQVTSGTFSPIIGKGIAMGLIKNEKIFKDGDLLIDIRGKKYPAVKENKNFIR
jgi:aminomethyltransferase